MQGVRKGYRGLQGITGNDKGLPGLKEGYNGLQWVTKSYKGLQTVENGYTGLQGLKRVSGKEKALHRVRRSSRGYKG